MSTEKINRILQQAKFIVEKHYEIGEILIVEELHGGCVNSSFTIQTKKNGILCRYVLRKYNPTTTEEKIQFEHGLISHLRRNGFELAAAVISNISGETYVKEKEVVKDQSINIFWAIFDFLSGEDRYSWMDTHLSDKEIESAAKVLGRLHISARDFMSPSKVKSGLPGIMDFLPTLRQTYSEYSHNAGSTTFDQYFLKKLDSIFNQIAKSLIPDDVLNKLPIIPIHGDYHQGNLKYEESQVIGVFDFDWSKLDLRLYDLGQAIVYFCACWKGSRAGSLDLDKIKLFLSSYNATCTSTADLGQLNSLERAYLPLILKAAIQYILYLVILDFYTTENPDSEEHLQVLDHYLKILNWIDANQNSIAAIANLT